MRHLTPLRLVWPIAGALLLAACGRNLTKADAYEAMGDGMMTSGAYGAAAGEYMTAASYDGNEPRRWLKYGRAQREAGNPVQAAQGFQRTLDLDPANIEALENMSVLMVRAGRYDDVHTYLDPLLVLAPDDPAGVLASGALALHERRFDVAATTADRLIAAAPDNGEGYLLKAHVLAGNGQAGEGARLLARFVADHPNDQRLAEELLSLYRMAGERAGIRATALLLARLEPDDPRYAMEAVRALRARGDAAGAAAQLDRVKARFGGNVEVMRAVADDLVATLPHDQAVAAVDALAAGRSRATAAMLAGKLMVMNAAPQALALLRPLAAGPVTNANVDVQATYASVLLASGRADAASAQAARVLAFDGGNDVALTVRARTALAQRDYATALTAAQTVAADKPDDPAAQLLVAQVYDQSGNQVLAAKAFGDAANTVPDSLEVVEARVRWLQAHGQAAVAKAIAAQFAGTHRAIDGAWTLYARACTAAGDARCAAAARGQTDVGA